MPKKESRLQIRISYAVEQRLKWLADQYAGGDVTKWVTHAVLEAPRKMLVKKPRSR